MFQKLKQFFSHVQAKPVLASRSPQWKDVRNMWLLQHPICEGCGTEKKLEVHHLVPVHIDPARELDPTNLITLCEWRSHDCHYHLGHLLNWKAYNPTCAQDAKAFKTAVDNRPYAQPPKALPRKEPDDLTNFTPPSSPKEQPVGE